VNGRALRFAPAWLMGVCAGCASAPVHYYTLAPPPDKASSISATSFAIDVRVDHIPPLLNRSELAARTGPAEVTLLENERWASPVKNEIQNALRLELQRHMSALRPVSSRLTIEVDVQRFEAELGQYVLFEAFWSATFGARAASCAFQADEKIRDGYSEMIEGYQRALGAFAGTIVEELTSPTNDSGGACQESKGH
jgi:uncharacterized lipoprotein YmbA